MWYRFLADALTVVHLSYVGFVVVGQLLIWAGLLFRWKWVRNPWFRCLHLLAIVIVALETLAGVRCPLTVWEEQLRDAVGDELADGEFVRRFLVPVLFSGNLIRDNVSGEFLAGVYYGVAALVLLTFVLAPPRFRRVSPAAAPKVGWAPPTESPVEMVGGAHPTGLAPSNQPRERKVRSPP
jgi:hypothetical protein